MALIPWDACLKCIFLDLTPEPLSQDYWGWDQARVVEQASQVSRRKAKA